MTCEILDFGTHSICDQAEWKSVKSSEVLIEVSILLGKWRHLPDESSQMTDMWHSNPKTVSRKHISCSDEQKLIVTLWHKLLLSCWMWQLPFPSVPRSCNGNVCRCFSLQFSWTSNFSLWNNAKCRLMTAVFFKQCQNRWRHGVAMLNIVKWPFLQKLYMHWR